MPSPPHSRLTAALVLLGATVLLAGCGARQAAVLNLTAPAKPTHFKPLGYPRAGIALLAPDDWASTSQPPPGVVVISSGPAVISLWRYPRSGPALSGPAALAGARSALVAAARAKDPTLQLLRSGYGTVRGAHGLCAVILSGLETINGRRRRVRSEHVYAAGAEYVLDEYAPLASFATVDHQVFSPVRKSLALLGSST